MNIVFVTTYDSTDINAWSGTIYSMRRALIKSGVKVDTIDKLADPFGGFFLAKRAVTNFFLRKNYLRDREPLTLRRYAMEVQYKLGRLRPDVILSPGTKPIAYLRTDTPIVFWADATFDGMIDFYPEYTNLTQETLRNGHIMEQAALSNCSLAVYASEWAASTALANYKVDAGKVKVVPYGANLSSSPNEEAVQKAVASRVSGACKLLFVGVDWHRKGGEDALSVVSRLNDHGLDAELYIVGCTPPSRIPVYAKTYGYLSKDNPKDDELLRRLYLSSDFLLLPAKAEGFGVVIAEANAFGLPVLATNVGGIGTAIVDGQNGRKFDSESFVKQCVDYILLMYSEKGRYRQLCMSAFEEYSTRLNWDTAVEAVFKLIRANGIHRSFE